MVCDTFGVIDEGDLRMPGFEKRDERAVVFSGRAARNAVKMQLAALVGSFRSFG